MIGPFLEGAINRILSLDPESVAALEPLVGKTVVLRLVGSPVELHLLVESHGVAVTSAPMNTPVLSEPSADVIIEGTPLAVLRMLSQDMSNENLAGSGVAITGDVAVMQNIKRAADRLHIDWEEHLATLVGDTPAHQLMRIGAGFYAWAGERGRSFTQDLSEYLRDESALVPTREDIERYLTDVDVIRDDTERLSVRIERLHRALDGSST